MFSFWRFPFGERALRFGLSPRSRRRVTAAAALGLLGVLSAQVAPAGELRNLKLSAEGLAESDVARPGDPAPFLDWARIRVSADGEWIVYPHDDRFDEVFELYAVRRDGSERARLSPDLAPGESIEDFWITPDGRTVLSRRGTSTPDRFALYRVPIAGPSSEEAPVFLPKAGRSVHWNVKLSDDGRVVVFPVESSSGPTDQEIWIVRLDEGGPAPRVVYPTATWTAPVTGIWLTPDSSRVVVRAGAILSMSVDATSEEWVRLDEGEATGETWSADQVLFSPDSQRAILLKSVSADQLRREAFGVPVAGPGSAAVRLNPPLEDGSARVGYVVPTPDSSHALLSVRADWRWNVWTVPIAGPASAAIRVSLPPTGANGASGPLPTPDSSEVLYSMATDFGAPTAYRVPIVGPPEASEAVTPPLAEGAPFAWKRLTPDGRFLLYAVDGTQSLGKKQAFAVPLETAPDGWFPTFGEFTDESWASWYLVGPASRWIALVADFESPDRYEIYRAFLDRPQRPVERVNPELPPGAFVRNEMLLTPDGYGIVYRADAETAGKIELWIADGLVFRDSFESGDLGRWDAEARSQ